MANRIKSLKPNPNGFYKQGYYTPLNENKYGDNEKIIYRSGLELQFCRYCDENEKILKWVSEPLAVKYFNPISKTVRNYYPDYLIKILINGVVTIMMVEVKASNMLQMPKLPSKYSSKKKKNNFLKRKADVIVNMAKFHAAKEYCKQRGWKYTFLTEDFFKR